MTKSGGRIPFFYTGVRVVIDGRPHVLSIGVDISERKRAEEHLRDALAQAEAAKKRARGGGTPAWVKDAVFYQIFPERFANGDKSNDPEQTQAWGGEPENFNFFGGDLAGVEQKLPYIKSLGINAIYFNPLFKSSSNHKYNTSDYMQIDPHFGTNAQFKALVAKCHGMGIKVIIDGVFNHTGDDHVWFQDAKKNGKASKYWNYYNIYGFPVVTDPKPNYDAWWGFGTLPKMRVAENPEVQKNLYDVVDYWTRQGIDGWRLDVPNEIASDSFWQGFRLWRHWRRTRCKGPLARLRQP